MTGVVVDLGSTAQVPSLTIQAETMGCFCAIKTNKIYILSNLIEQHVEKTASEKPAMPRPKRRRIRDSDNSDTDSDPNIVDLVGARPIKRRRVDPHEFTPPIKRRRVDPHEFTKQMWLRWIDEGMVVYAREEMRDIHDLIPKPRYISALSSAGGIFELARGSGGSKSTGFGRLRLFLKLLDSFNLKRHGMQKKFHWAW